MRIYWHICCPTILFDLKIYSKFYGSKFSRQKQNHGNRRVSSCWLRSRKCNTHNGLSTIETETVISGNLPLHWITVSLQGPTFFYWKCWLGFNLKTYGCHSLFAQRHWCNWRKTLSFWREAKLNSISIEYTVLPLTSDLEADQMWMGDPQWVRFACKPPVRLDELQQQMWCQWKNCALSTSRYSCCKIRLVLIHELKFSQTVGIIFFFFWSIKISLKNC